MKNNRYFKHNENDNHVIKVSAEGKKGFATIIQGLARGVELIGEHILETQYTECSYDHFKNHIGKGTKEWKK